MCTYILDLYVHVYIYSCTYKTVRACIILLLPHGTPYTKLKLSASPLCSCGTEQQTVEHILQRCPHLEDKTKSVWPRSIPIRDKLYGKREDLKKTTSLIAGSGVTI